MKMIIEGNYEYKSAIILTPDIIRELDTLFRSKYDSISYTAKLKNQSSVEYASLDEMLGMDNALEQKIMGLKVFGSMAKLFVSFEPSFSPITNFKYTVFAKYTLSDADDETIFRINLKRILDKAKAPCAFLYKFHLFQVVLITLVVVLGFLGVLLLRGEGFNRSSISTRELFIIVFETLIYMLASFFFSYFWKYLFPPIIFMWGEEVKKSARKATAWDRVLWGIIMTIIVGLVVTLIGNAIL
jgi:hypothetical protein